jgi:hypothetical protein
MAADDTSGSVTLWKSGRKGLYADDHGLTVQRSERRIRTIRWPEISRIEETGGYDSQSGMYLWGLSILLHTGEKVSANMGWYGTDAPQIAASVMQVAEGYGIPANLTGVPTRGGRPVRRGIYGDPSGQAGLRYWDGSQWSPFLPEDIARPASVILRESPDSWSALPAADGRWTYAAAQARRYGRWSAVFAIVSAMLVAGGVVARLRWDNGTNDPSFLFWLVGVVPAGWALRALIGRRRLFLKLDRAARAAPGTWSSSLSRRRTASYTK